MTTIEDRLHEAFTAPLDEVVDAERRCAFPADPVGSWDLPADDRAALLRWGLPTDIALRPAPQPGREPLLVPNLAGPQERRLASPGQRLYDLGRWGGSGATPRIGAVAGDGRVLAVRDRPVTAADLPLPLRGIYRDLYRPAVAYLNASVARFVEVAWRWSAAAGPLRELTEPPVPGTRAELLERHGSAERAAAVMSAWEDAADAHLERARDCERRALAGVRAVDPTIGPGGAESLWLEAVYDRPC
ncbi:SUKH-4 family immunity protein [Actinomadura macrotermitis]|nr:SUKH-4 family immunity protein [Actinomadura macrotermitis]